MKVIKTSRKKNQFVILDSIRYRDQSVVIPNYGNMLFLTTLKNSYNTYELISMPVSNGTYKVKIVSIDNLGNKSVGIESTVNVDFFPLPPKNISLSVLVNTVTLSWDHSANGAPDSYVIYGNNGSGNIDRTTPIDTISGTLKTHTFVVVDGQWKFVVESLKSGVESNTLEINSSTVPTSGEQPPDPGIPGGGPFGVTALVLENASVGKAKMSFYWPHGNLASDFNVYHNGGSGDIDFGSPAAFTFPRQNKFVQIYTTTQLHSIDQDITYKFAVRAKTSLGVESTNEDVYEIAIDGVAPDNADNLILDSVF